MAWIGNAAGGATCQIPRALGTDFAALLHRMHPAVDDDRRGTSRSAIPFLFELAPMPDEVPALLSHSVVVVGKDITDRGIGFYHQQPIPFKRGLLSIDLPDEGIVRVEIDLLWCRFTSLGWYESGGRLRSIANEAYPQARAG